jgi:hypothetical protein
MYISVSRPEALDKRLVQITIGPNKDIIFVNNISGINLRIPKYGEDDNRVIGAYDIIPTNSYKGAFFIEEHTTSEFIGYKEFDTMKLVNVQANRLMSDSVLNIVEYDTWVRLAVHNSRYRDRQRSRAGIVKTEYMAVPVINFEGTVVGFKANVDLFSLSNYTRHISTLYKIIHDPNRDDSVVINS